MGTRSWSCELSNKYKVGDTIFVKAGHFDSKKDKYSDFFAHKTESLLEGIILSVHNTSVRARFLIDDSVSSINFKELQTITDDNRHLIHVEQKEDLDDDSSLKDSPVFNDVFLGNITLNSSLLNQDSISNKTDLVPNTDSDSSFDIADETLERVFNNTQSGIEQIRLKNIAKNNKVLKDLGFEIQSKRKFDRHVLNLPEPEDESQDDETCSNDDTNEKPLMPGEEVYLKKDNVEIFKARYENIDQTDTGGPSTVHGVPLKDGEGRFFITKILRGATKWDAFDEDRMSPGAAISWGKKDLKRRSAVVVTSQGTEAKPPTPLEVRKRKRHPEKWQKNKKKKLVNSGHGKELKPPCGEKCRLRCHEKFSEELRSQIFNEFYASADKAMQTQQLSTLVTVHPKKGPRDKENVNSRRQYTREYYLSLKDMNVKVCQKMFLNTFSIDEKRIRTLINNRTETGAPIRDMRGRHNNHVRNAEREKPVIEHIMSFKVVESHYVRRDSKYEYLPTELNVSAMYRMYKEWIANKNYPIESYDFYYRVFREKFNIKFQKPKKDVCDTCQEYQNIENKTEEMKVAQEKHLQDKDAVRVIKQNAKDEALKNLKFAAAAFDLEKVLLTPHGQTSSFYYSRRLSNHNFTVTELDNMSTWCFFWSEQECERGACEISTGLFKYLISRRNAGITDFHLFSDRCGGQNNNRMMFVMLSYAVNNYNINSIRLTYLVSGHSQSENDNAHSLIETMSSKSTIYTPAEWETLIQCSFNKNRCFFQVLDHTSIIDFKSQEAFPEYADVYSDKTNEVMTKEQITKQKSLNVALGLEKRKPQKIYWSEIVDLKFEAKDPEVFMFKYAYKENYRKATFSLPKRELRISEQRERKKEMRRYDQPCGIAPKKKEDLLKLCKKNLIPARHHAFYENIPVAKKEKVSNGESSKSKKKEGK